MRLNRREFAWASTWGLWAGGLSATQAKLLQAFAEEASPVSFPFEIETVARILERTPRAKCLETMIRLIKQGIGYRQFLGGLFLAGIRNVNPRPPGFKLHCVLAMNAVHQFSLDAEPADRFLPLAWALDYFKKSQDEDAAQGDFQLRVSSADLPSVEQAWDQFHAGMRAWDLNQAESAMITLVRNRGAQEIVEGLWLYGARDYRNIGHKAILVANAARTLETIGWQHAEPVWRSVVSSLLDFGPTQVVNLYGLDDQCFPAHSQLASEQIGQLPTNWAGTDTKSPELTRTLVATLRQGHLADARQLAWNALVKQEAQASAIWDAIHLAAGDLMLRQPGIYGIHAVTSTNALHYAFRVSSVPTTRLILMLQGLGWVTQFHALMMSQKPKLNSHNILELERGPIPNEADLAVQDIFHVLPHDRSAAAARAYAYGKQFWTTDIFTRQARKLVLMKAQDPHDYKFPAAVFENLQHVHRTWQPHLLAIATQQLPGIRSRDSDLLVNAREALRKL